MEQIEFSLTSLLIVTILSFFIPILLKKFKRVSIPVIVGEIVVGMLIGKSGFDIIVVDDSLRFLQFFGLAYLMFTAGLEIDFEVLLNKNVDTKIKSKVKSLSNPIILSTLLLTITLVLAYISSLILKKYNLISDPMFMSLIIGTTSLGIVMPTLKEKRLSGTNYGQYIITGAVMADFVTMLLISVVLSIFEGGLTLDILLVFVLLVLVFVLYRISTRLQDNPIFAELAHGTTQLGIRGSFAVMLLFLVLTQYIGVEMILGAFLAGMVVSLASQTYREEIYHKLDAIGFGFLIPIFFILVGVNFDFSVFIKNPKGLLLVPLLFVLVYVVKGLPALLLKLVFPFKEAVAGGVLLTSKLSLTIAAAAIGLQIGAISEEVSAAILLVSILTSIISPITFEKLIPTQENTEEEKHIVIIGSTKQTLLLAKRLVKDGIHVLIIESKRDKAEDMLTRGIEVVWGNALDMELLDEIDMENARAAIVGTGNNEVNFQISCRIVKHFKREVITLLDDPVYIEKAQSNEKIRVVNPHMSTVSLLETMIHHPLTTTILEDKRDLHIEEVEVINPSIIGKKLRHVKMPGDILIFSIYRNGETLVPHGDTEFEQGDIVLVVGTNNDIKYFSKFALDS
ncbi:hypothetical protein BHF71_08265 [Vulcanibacillus modesticaldus]|uniref:Sodium:proton antiporter n=1 Tax=Vulcanibacillus modesticaldus TaxID=337097 RepID=A0A1D2YVC0_9BACI|nr:monovalent cation:proton antiporter family protein [Vulcanibacillus modesticaldus]OEF99607.1 hypothetical protein BHF71_08265 [Vulcanibacillus modesticaldus]